MPAAYPASGQAQEATRVRTLRVRNQGGRGQGGPGPPGNSGGDITLFAKRLINAHLVTNGGQAARGAPVETVSSYDLP